MNASQYSRYERPVAKEEFSGNRSFASGTQDLQNIDHPVSWGGRFAFISSQQPYFNKDASVPLGDELNQAGIKWDQAEGRYGASEPTYVVHDIDRDQAMEMARKRGQEAIVFSPGGGHHELIYVNGPKAGKYHPIAQPGTELFQTRPNDNFTHIPGVGFVRMHFDFNKLLDVPKKQIEGNPTMTQKPEQPAEKSEVTVTDIKKSLADSLKRVVATFEDMQKREAAVKPIGVDSSSLEWMQELSKSDDLAKATPLSKPPTSEAQRRAMGAAASGHSTLGIPKKVGEEFIEKDPGGKLPKKQTKKAEDFIQTDAPPAKTTDDAKKGGPRMVEKGKREGTVPGDKAPVKAKGDEGSGGEMEKAAMRPDVGSAKAAMHQASFAASKPAAAPAAKPAMHQQYAGRAQDLMGQISSAKQASTKPTPAGPSKVSGLHQAPMAGLGRVAPAKRGLFRSEDMTDAEWMEELSKSDEFLKDEVSPSPGATIDPGIANNSAMKSEDKMCKCGKGCAKGECSMEKAAPTEDRAAAAAHRAQFTPKPGSQTQRKKQLLVERAQMKKLGASKKQIAGLEATHIAQANKAKAGKIA